MQEKLSKIGDLETTKVGKTELATSKTLLEFVVLEFLDSKTTTGADPNPWNYSLPKNEPVWSVLNDRKTKTNPQFVSIKVSIIRTVS